MSTPRDTCGAQRSRGRGVCRSPILGAGGRCRAHGGASTGPRTPEGKARSIAAGRASLERVNRERAARRQYRQSTADLSPTVPRRMAVAHRTHFARAD